MTRDVAAVMRRIKILTMLPRSGEGGLTVREIRDRLAEELPEDPPNVRTLQRDMNDLSQLFPITDDGARQPRWSWSGREVVEIPEMGPDTALSFRLVEKFLARLMPPSGLRHLRPHFARAGQVLRRQRLRTYARWSEKVAIRTRELPLRPAPVRPAVIASTYDALFRERVLCARYHARSSGKEREHRIHPLGLVHRGPVTELVGIIEPHTDPVRLMLHRFSRARVLEEPARIPRDFSLQRYIQGPAFAYPGDGRTITLRARFVEPAAYHLAETPLSDDQEIEPTGDGWRVVRATLPYSEQLVWWLLGFGDQVEVLEPEDLRSLMAETAAQMADLYRT